MNKKSTAQRSMLDALRTMCGDTTLSALASRCGTTNAGAKHTLRSLEDAGEARELFDGRWALR